MVKIDCEQKNFDDLASALGPEVEGDDVSLEILITDEEDIRRLNAAIRGVDAVTDVLSFPSLDGIKGKTLKKEEYPLDLDEDGNICIGSVAVCEQVCARQAEEYGHSFERELNYLAAHGALHLLGYDHMEDGDKKQMRDAEKRVMARMGLSGEEDE